MQNLKVSFVGNNGKLNRSDSQISSWENVAASENPSQPETSQIGSDLAQGPVVLK